MAQIVEGTRRLVLKLGYSQLGRKAVFSALGAISQKAAALHAESWRDILIVEEGAVVDDVGERSLVRKTPLFEHRVEADEAFLPGLHRPVKMVDAIVKTSEVLNRMSTFDLEFLHLQWSCPAQLHLIKWRTGVILDGVLAMGDRTRLIGIQIDLQRHLGDLGLWHRLETEQRLFRVGGIAFLVLDGLVGIENAGVVVDIGTAWPP